MHVVHQLFKDLFEIKISECEASPEAIFPNWHAHDRFGLVIDEAFGGLGATNLLQLAISLYYDVKPSRRTDRKVYPEIYSFHIGRGYGAHAGFDFWPARRENIILSGDHRDVLDAINNCGITRLAVPDRSVRQIDHRPKEVDAALDRIESAFIYNAAGRVDPSDFTIAGLNPRTEQNPASIIRPKILQREFRGTAQFKEADPEFVAWMDLRSADVTDDDRIRAEARRTALTASGFVRESYRFTSITDALLRL